jgi:hypothetical protein
LPAVLWVATARDDARLVGAFQRATAGAAGAVARRGSGGPEVRVAKGTVHVALSLASPDALTPCGESRIVNRSVRPLLRALTKVTGRPAHFFGRDWVSVAHRPVAWAGFAHDAGTRRTVFEAFVGVRAPFADGPRASLLDKAAVALEAALDRPLDPAKVADAVADAYLAAYVAEEVEVPAPEDGADAGGDAGDLGAEPPWAATREEAIGTVAAGPDASGVLRVGGDLLVSRDALARLERRAAEAEIADVGRVVDETLGAPGVALDGVRTLESVRDVIIAARSLAPRR